MLDGRSGKHNISVARPSTPAMSVAQDQDKIRALEDKIKALEARINALGETKREQGSRWNRSNRQAATTQTTDDEQPAEASCSHHAPTLPGSPPHKKVAPGPPPPPPGNALGSPPPPLGNAPPLAPRRCTHHLHGKHFANDSVTCSRHNQVKSPDELTKLFTHLQATLFTDDQTGFDRLWYRVESEMLEERVEVHFCRTQANRFVVLRLRKSIAI